MDAMRQRASSQGAAVARDLLAFVELAARDDDVGAALGERLDHAIAEPARSAGDERDLAGEIEQRIGGHAAPLSRMAARRVGICSLGNSPGAGLAVLRRSEEHTSELQSLMRISYAVFCLKKTQYTAQK